MPLDDTTTMAVPLPTTTMTTAHPHSFPLPWAQAHFHSFTKDIVKDYHVMHLMFAGRTMKPWGHSSR